MSEANERNTIAVVGGGLAGLICAVALADAGHDLHLIAPAVEPADGRTTAMLNPTLDLLDEVGLREGLDERSAPLRIMRLIDDTQRLLRAPLTEFAASEMDLEAFGYNVPNAFMVERASERLGEMQNVTRHDALLSDAIVTPDGVVLTLDNGTVLTVAQAVAADGKHSKLRDAAGISTRNWSYPQTALVTTFAHTIPHGGVSAEFHTQTGPFTQVPLPAKDGSRNRSSLVWVVRPEQVDGITSLDEDTLSRRIEDGLHSSFGAVTVERPLQSFPLAGLTAKSFAVPGVALVGEAAHLFPPIGAQGFNLAARDISDLRDALATNDPGSRALADAYHRARSADIHLRTTGVDVMNRSLLTDFLPVQAGRAAGIAALNMIGPLRRFAMRQGLGA